MKLDALVSPGLIGSGHQLRAACTKAISYVEVQASLRGGKYSEAKTLDTFFAACRTAIASFLDAVLPTYVSGAIALATPKVLTLTYSEALDASIVPAATAFVSSPAKTWASIQVSGSTVILTATTAFAPGVTTVTYTAPGTNALRDGTGNLLATHGPSAITNNVV